jgi:hypothetical protein
VADSTSASDLWDLLCVLSDRLRLRSALPETVH